MVIKTPITGTRSIEYVEEATYGTIPTNPTLLWLGLVNPFTSPIKRTMEEVRYLSAAAATKTLHNVRNVQVGGELGASFTYKVQDWDLVKYITGSATGLADDIKSISLVQGIEIASAMKYIVYKGCVLSKWSLTLPKSGIATADVDVVIGDVADPSADDPAGIAGAHASEAAGNPFIWEDITDLKMDANDPPTTAIAHNVGDIKLEILNDVELPKDVDSTMWTDTGGYNVKIASMSVSLELGWIDVSFFDLVKASTKQNLKFTLGNKTFLVKGLIFPEFNPEIKPDDLMGQVVTAVMDQPDLTIT